MVAAKSKDPFGLRHVADACGVDQHFFKVLPLGEGPTLALVTANRDTLFTGPNAQVKTFVDGLRHGCDLALGHGHAQARQQLIGGGETKTPVKKRPPAQAGLFPGEAPKLKAKIATPAKKQRSLL
jgi:hypothetical protein